MSDIETKNRNYFFEFIFKCYITFLLKIIGINEEVDNVLSTSLISIDRGENPSLFHNIMDYPVLTKSGKILLFEFKKGILRTADFKQLYDHVSKIKRKENREAKLTEELCDYIIHYSSLFPSDELENVIIAMFFNIVEYIDEDKQQNLMEAINMETAFYCLEDEIEKRGIDKGRDEGRKLFARIFEKSSFSQIAEYLDIDEGELREFMGK